MFREARGSVPLIALVFRVAGSGCSKVVFKLLVPLTFCVAPGVAPCVDEGVVTGVPVVPGCSKVAVVTLRVPPSFRVAPGVPVPTVTPTCISYIDR